MKKLSSAILLVTLLVFINCKSNAGETIGKDDKEDSLNIFYQSLIKLGNGFIDVFNAFSGLVADTFFKADPKKSDVKSYFTSLCEKLKSTKEKLGNLSNGNEKGANGNEKGDSADSKSGDAVGSVVGEVSKWLEDMIKAAEEAIVGATGDGKIGESANNGAAAEADSVKKIAKGMKGIVDAAGTAAGKKEDVLKDVQDAGDADAETGKLFGTAGGADADAADIKKAAEAVSSVSGEQILKAIVDAAGKEGGEQEGKAPGAARNPIAAAIGNGAGDGVGVADMKKKDKVAEEAIVGAATGDTKIGESANNGAAADADSVKKIAKGMKGIVDAAGTAAGKKEDALKDVQVAGAAEEAAGKLFGTGGGNAANADAVKKAAEAVSSVSGEQILKAIVNAAGGGEQDGAAPGAAKNPIAAAIGNGAAGAGADFGDDMKKKDKVAEEAIVGAATGDTKIGESVDNGAAADANSVKKIAKGMKGIVDAAGTAAGKKEDVLKDVQVAGDADAAEAGKLFGTAGGDAADADIKKAAEAVSSVSGEQILKAIVDAAGKEGEQEGQAPNAAKNPIAAAIGNGDAGAGFGVADMRKKDKVAAALVLRGLAKGGKFSAAANDANVKSAVENAVGKKEDVLKDVKADAGAADQETGKLFGTTAGADADAADIKKVAEAVSSVSGEQILKAIVDAAAGGEQEGKAPNVAKNPIAAAIGAAAAGAAANFGDDMKKKDKVAAALVLRGLAKDGKFSAAAAAEAGKLFGAGAGGGAGDADIKKAAEAVSSVSGEQILKAIVDAATDGTKIGESVDNGAAAEANSVKNIAKGMKGIVDAAGTAAGKKEDVLKDVKADAGEADAAAGKLFGAGAGGDADADDIKKVAEAVSSVSGEQILKAIVDAAGKEGEQDGAAPGAARNPIAAAIGAAAGGGANFGNDMKKKDKVAAALVLRGLAKDGKFSANANDNGANVKSAVENAVGKKDGVLKDVQAAAGDAAEAGKLFGTAGGGNAADADAIKKAAEAVSSVSGEQILKAIVDAAGKEGGEQEGKAPGAARNPIAAAIGNGAGANFVDNDMKKKDKVAAALVLRGLAKDGKFSTANANDANVKSAVENAVGGKTEDVLKDVQAAGDAAQETGKLFGAGVAGDAGAEDIKKVAEAVSSVSGEQGVRRLMLLEIRLQLLLGLVLGLVKG
ncbi:variable large family protein [Borreliella burgdorferi]|uniref:variable large family protein n=1 Tax=Borreliella burgdorferi TaxID=139 RepID=UPI0011B1E4E0|nr:variable large family protein [Borreliella burgdorferi]